VTSALDGVRVVELASDQGAFAGRLLAGLGADVVLVEPPGGHPARRYEPFVDDDPGVERSLWWWHYQAGKRGVVLDLDSQGDADRLRELITAADVVLEGEAPGTLAARGLDWPDLHPSNERLIWASITAFGRDNPRTHEQFTDLTVLAGGGPVWMCGYDDHSIPPVRGGGNQGYQTACIWAVMSVLAALWWREETGRGQLLDLSMHAAANVTTESGSYEWLVARATVQRQTGRHASVHPTQVTRTLGTDGHEIHTGFPPRSSRDFETLLDWLDDVGARDEYEATFWLEMGIERGGVQMSEITNDVEATEIFFAAREALNLIASKMTAYEFFIGAQERRLACGIIYSPEEVLTDPHFVARGFPTKIEHEDLGRAFTYPGAPFHMPASPFVANRRAPHLGEHQADVLGPGQSADARPTGHETPVPPMPQ